MQWHLDSMQAEEIWQTSRGRGVTVAVIDTGVGELPELAGQVLPGKDFARASGDERDDYRGHGTGIAALIAGTGKSTGGDGSYGLAPEAKILPLRVSEGGAGEGLHQSTAEAIRFAADSDAKVLNISFGGIGASDTLDAAVKYAVDKGKLIFAAVGNEGETTNEVIYPAASPGVVGVAAVDRKADATSESQHGAQVDLAAPGTDIVTACLGKTGLCKTHGTSDATALASASAALIWAEHPDWTNNQVLRVMLNTAGKPRDGVGRNDYVGHGVVRPRIALTRPGDPGPADEFPLPELAAAQPGGTPSPAGGSAAPAAPGPVTEAPADDRTGLYLALGAGAAVLLGAAVAVAVVRSRRNT
ncbi:type VII secretion-associated serine protease mycosin [Streptomyces sp. NBC_00239]|uniref:type VII secretion-associated serine protease mycosin n=1 Tax=Streptomyces sp. NBC_00239 TaxID=2903640 RepID=UPI002E2C461B|nr:type VII secretion-associated serine protease mycosin [Streptomyces sp. NBC_00239]